MTALRWLDFDYSEGAGARLLHGKAVPGEWIAAAVGLSVQVAQSALAFSLVKYIGAVYLIYLGVRMLMSRQVSVDATPVAVSGSRRPSTRA